MSEHTKKRPVWFWVVGGLAALCLVAFIGCNVWRNTPRQFSQLCPEARTAATCRVAVWDFTGEPRLVTGEELEELVSYLDQFEFYPESGNSLEGDDLWQLTFIEEDGGYASVQVTSRGVLLDSKVYVVRTGRIEIP